MRCFTSLLIFIGWEKLWLQASGRTRHSLEAIKTESKDWGYCCEYTNIFPFSPLFKVSITFLISFWLPLFRLYYLKTTDIFPTFLPSNTFSENPYLMKGTLGTCFECIRNFPPLACHVQSALQCLDQYLPVNSLFNKTIHIRIFAEVLE